MAKKMDDDGKRLRKIEEDLFFAFAKKEIEAEQGVWDGSVEHNRLADMKVSSIVKTSFKNYEKNRRKEDQQYFVVKNKV